MFSKEIVQNIPGDGYKSSAANRIKVQQDDEMSVELLGSIEKNKLTNEKNIEQKTQDLSKNRQKAKT